MSYDLSFDKRSATLLAACGAAIALLLVAAGVLIGIRHNPAPIESAPSIPAAVPTPAAARDQAQTSGAAPKPSAPVAPSPFVTPAIPPASASDARPAASPDFTLQLGAFKEQANAQGKVKDLKEKGVTANVVSVQDIAGVTWYAVRSGSYANVSEASAAARDLRRSSQEQVIVRPSDHL
jgi:DedD protein